MRQQLARGLAVGDEIVVDEIDRAERPARQHGVELGQDLLRLLEARLAAIERRDVAELAAVRAAAGELHRAQHVFAAVDQVIGRDRKVRQRQAVGGLEALLRRRPADIAIERGDQRVGRIADFADMEIVEFAVELRAGGDRRAADRAHLAARMGAARDIQHRLALDVHAADEHRVRPVELALRGRADILIDEPNFPMFRQIGRDQQDALRRHECLHAHQLVGMLEGAEGRCVARKNAQDAACMSDDDLASHGRPLSVLTRHCDSCRRLLHMNVLLGSLLDPIQGVAASCILIVRANCNGLKMTGILRIFRHGGGWR